MPRPGDDARFDLPPDARVALPEHLTSLDLDIVAAFEAERQPGEVFLWMGRPDRARAAGRATVPALIAVGSVLVALTILASHCAARPVPPLTGGFFALVGTLLACGAIGCRASAAEGRRASQTVYALSDRRALAREPLGPSDFVVRSFGPDQLAGLALVPDPWGGPGADLVFDSPRGAGRSGRGSERRGFRDLERDEAEKVVALVRAYLLPFAQELGPAGESEWGGADRFEPIAAGSGFAMFDASPAHEVWYDRDFAQLDPELVTWTEHELASDEKLAWVGRPRPLRLIPSLRSVAPTSLVFVAAGLFVAGAFGGFWAPGQRLSTVVGLVFVLHGVVQLARAARAVLDRNRAVYLLTSRRAVVGTPSRGGIMRVESFEPHALGGMARREAPDGSGDLIFDESGPRSADGRDRSPTPRGFLGVERVRDVERLVRSTLLAELP